VAYPEVGARRRTLQADRRNSRRHRADRSSTRLDASPATVPAVPLAIELAGLDGFTCCATYADFWCRGMIITGTGAWRRIFEAAEPRKT
jgi:hypothetical protein